MRTLLALLVLAAPALGQPCPGDLNGDRRVTVAELVQAVNAALGGCDGQPTPTHTPLPNLKCPVRFTTDNTDDDSPVCWYTHATTGCGSVRFYGDGELGVLAIDTLDGTDFYGYRPTSDTTASIFGRWTKEDVSDFRAASGPINLNSAGDRITATAAGACGVIRIARFDQQRFIPRSAARAMLRILHDR